MKMVSSFQEEFVALQFKEFVADVDNPKQTADQGLERAINAWLKDNPDIRIVSHQSFSLDGSGGYAPRKQHVHIFYQQPVEGNYRAKPDP